MSFVDSKDFLIDKTTKAFFNNIIQEDFFFVKSFEKISSIMVLYET